MSRKANSNSRQRMGKCLALGILVLSGLISWSPILRAQEQKKGLYSVEERNLLGSHEISAALGGLPLDAFTKGISLKGTYTYHFSHLLGWELVGGFWSFNYENDLRQRLKDDFNVQPTDMGALKWVIDSSLVVRPLYGKVAVLNDKIFNSELFFTFGYALGGYTAAYPSGVNAGVGLRIFINRYFSTRLDIRDYVFFPEISNPENNLSVSLGLSITFGISDEASEQ